MSGVQAQLATLQASLADAERRVFESELIRRKLHNTIQELKGNIRVFCRVRPASDKEMADSNAAQVLATDFPNSGENLTPPMGQLPGCSHAMHLLLDAMVARCHGGYTCLGHK